MRDLSGRNTQNSGFQKYIHGIGICYVAKAGRTNNYLTYFRWNVNPLENRIFKPSKANKL